MTEGEELACDEGAYDKCKQGRRLEYQTREIFVPKTP